MVVGIFGKAFGMDSVQLIGVRNVVAQGSGCCLSRQSAQIVDSVSGWYMVRGCGLEEQAGTRPMLLILAW